MVEQLGDPTSFSNPAPVWTYGLGCPTPQPPKRDGPTPFWSCPYLSFHPVWHVVACQDMFPQIRGSCSVLNSVPPAFEQLMQGFFLPLCFGGHRPGLLRATSELPLWWGQRHRVVEPCMLLTRVSDPIFGLSTGLLKGYIQQPPASRSSFQRPVSFKGACSMDNKQTHTHLLVKGCLLDSVFYIQSWVQ